MNRAKLITIFILNLISLTFELSTQDNYSQHQCKNVNILLSAYCPLEYDEEFFIYDNNNNIINQIERKKEINSNSKENDLSQVASNTGEEISEEQCLEKKTPLNDKKYCYIKIYSEENNKIFYSNCLYLSKTQIEDNKYLESFIPKLNEPFNFMIKCEGFFFIKNYHPQLPNNIQCKDIIEPSSKEQCNNIKTSNSEYQCCYIETKYESKIEKECAEYDSESLKFEEDFINYLKFELIFNISDDNITNYDSIIKELSLLIPKYKAIKCNTYNKIIDYSKIKILKDDILLTKSDNFCPSVDADNNFKDCFDGLFFSDFSQNGGQCCYFEIKLENNTVQKQCIPLTQYNRENYYFIHSIIKGYNPTGNYTVTVICDGYKSEFDSLTGKWIKTTSN